MTSTSMHVTFVKKIMADGSLCPKCNEVSERLERDGLLDKVNYIAIADSNNPDSEGMQLAKKYAVERAPFFLVENDDGPGEIFDVYFKFKRHLKKLVARPLIQ